MLALASFHDATVLLPNETEKGERLGQNIIVIGYPLPKVETKSRASFQFPVVPQPSPQVSIRPLERQNDWIKTCTVFYY